MSFRSSSPNRIRTVLGAEVGADEVVSHDTKHAIVNLAADRRVETIIAEREPLRLRSRVLGDSIDWVVRHAPCDVLLVDNLGHERPEEVAISGGGMSYSALAVSVAEAIAVANRGRVSLWHSGQADGSERSTTLSECQSDLSEMLSVPVQTDPAQPDGGQRPDLDLLVRRGAGVRLRDVLFDERPTFPSPGCTTVTVYSRESRQPGVLRRLVERIVF